MPPAQQRAGRAIGKRRAAEIGLMLLLPGIMRPLAGLRRRIDGVVEPGMPLRRHARRLDLAIIKHPAPLAAPHAAAANQLPATLLPVVSIAELVGAGQLAPPPWEQPRAVGEAPSDIPAYGDRPVRPPRFFWPGLFPRSAPRVLPAA